jgi:hypothetical protein
MQGKKILFFIPYNSFGFPGEHTHYGDLTVSFSNIFLWGNGNFLADFGYLGV